MLLSVPDRFWVKVDKQGPVPSYRPDLGPCWLWTASLRTGGYGQFMLRRGVLLGAHRFSYEQVIGPVPEGLQLDHLCRVRRCVNPAHLEPVTTRENARRGVKGQQTHCVNGHPFDAKNTRRRPDGRRACRECSNESHRRRSRWLGEKGGQL